MGIEYIVMLAFLLLWVYAEVKLKRAARILSGLAAISCAAVLSWHLAGFIPDIERSQNRSSLRLAGELLATGETQRVQQAIQTYNSIAATGSTYRASMEMWDALNHEPK